MLSKNYILSEALGHDKKEKPLERIPISEWDNIAARYIKGNRRRTNAEVIYLGKKVYRSRASNFLPEGVE